MAGQIAAVVDTLTASDDTDEPERQTDLSETEYVPWRLFCETRSGSATRQFSNRTAAVVGGRTDSER